MARLLCIDDNWGSNPECQPLPEYMKDYIQMSDYDDIVCPCGCGVAFIRLYEFGPIYLYNKKHFALLDGPEDTAEALGEPMKRRIETIFFENYPPNHWMCK